MPTWTPETRTLALDGPATVQWTVRWTNSEGTADSTGEIVVAAVAPAAATSVTLLPADFTLVAGVIEPNTGGLGFDTLSAPLDSSTILDARRTLAGLTDGAYRVEVLHHDEADGPGTLELWVGDVLCASRLMIYEPTGDLAPTAANLITWTIPAINLRADDVLRVVCRPANGEPGRIRSVALERVGDIDLDLAPDTPPGGGSSSDALTGSGTLDLATAISHYTIDAPVGVSTIRGYTLAGFEPDHPDLADAHIYTVTSLANTETLGTLRHALKAGTANADGKTKGPRLVVFAVSGVIATGSSTVDATRNNTWVNGHVAPGPIVITGCGFKIRYSNILFEGVYCQLGAPANVSAADNSKGISINRSAQTGENNVLDCGAVQCAFFNGVDEAPSTFIGGTYPVNIVRPVFSDNTISHGYRAPNLTGAWANWHETRHNYGTLISGGTWNAFVGECVHAGCDHRTPVGKRASTMVVYGCFTHDINVNTYRPIQLYDTNDNGVGVGESTFPLLANGSIKAERHVTAIGNYFEPGELCGTKTLPTAYIQERNSSTSICRFFTKANRFDDTLAANQFTGALGADNTAPAVVPATYRVASPVPLVWPDRLPTHPSETRAWTLAHAGPRPNNRAAVPLFNTYMAAIAAQRAKARSVRDQLYLTTTATPSLGTLGSWTAPTLPSNPWATEANGFLRVVNWMHQLRADLGGTPFGNV
ncbi:hypothetical protein, partial [Rubrimonas sp.]|uniref:hypothetical protein n=1 Tax=Rubrimonas sp. TaxID=2036015 RepID=UPI002FDD68EB